jgi:hypothetical protein
VALLRIGCTIAVAARARRIRASETKLHQPIAASVRLLSGTPLAVKASAASATAITVAR